METMPTRSAIRKMTKPDLLAFAERHCLLEHLDAPEALNRKALTDEVLATLVRIEVEEDTRAMATDTQAATVAEVIGLAEAKPKTKKAAKAPEAPAEAKPATGPRGELLDRKGAALDGELAGYVVVLPFREFETAKAGPEVGQGEPRWITRCVAHGTYTPAASGTEAERNGARKARASWCKACAKAVAK